MDFSSVLANEIRKKKAQPKKRRRDVKQSIVESKKPKEIEESNIGPENEVPPSKDHVEEITKSTSPAHTPPEDSELVNTISTEQLNAKLDEFNELTNEPDLSKVQKIQKLQVLMTLEAKNEKYKTQIEKEAKLNDDPALKQINLLHISDVEANRDALQVQLRVLLKDIIAQWEATGGDTSLVGETKRDMVLLLYRLRANKLSRDMLTSLATILYYIQQKDFRRANESYMKLSIGNVAWPIGIRDVGIHARSATLKITGEKVAANIMINDKTRRWITSIKRLITYSERKSKEEDNDLVCLDR